MTPEPYEQVRQERDALVAERDALRAEVQRVTEALDAALALATLAARAALEGREGTT